MRQLVIIVLVVLLLSCSPLTINKNTYTIVIEEPIKPNGEDTSLPVAKEECERTPPPIPPSAPRIPYITTICEADIECVETLLLDHIVDLRNLLNDYNEEYQKWTIKANRECK